jgi:hypothetical protein
VTKRTGTEAQLRARGAPRQGGFATVLVFSERAVEQARSSDLPAYVLERIEQAKPYAEGRSLRFEVNKAEDLEVVKAARPADPRFFWRMQPYRSASIFSVLLSPCPVNTDTSVSSPAARRR